MVCLFRQAGLGRHTVHGFPDPVALNNAGSGRRPTCAASASAMVVFPDPLRPPIAMMRAAAFVKEVAGKLEIGFGFGDEDFGRAACLLDLCRCDMRPHGRPYSHEEGQQDETVFVVGLIEIAVHDQIGELEKPRCHRSISRKARSYSTSTVAI